MVMNFLITSWKIFVPDHANTSLPSHVGPLAAQTSGFMHTQLLRSRRRLRWIPCPPQKLSDFCDDLNCIDSQMSILHAVSDEFLREYHWAKKSELRRTWCAVTSTLGDETTWRRELCILGWAWRLSESPEYRFEEGAWSHGETSASLFTMKLMIDPAALMFVHLS